jgi:hypothetical protein
VSREQAREARKAGAEYGEDRRLYFPRAAVPEAWREFIEPDAPRGSDGAEWWQTASGITERGAGLELRPEAFGVECWQSFRVAVLDCAKALGDPLPSEAWPEFQDSVRVADWRAFVGVRQAPTRRPEVLRHASAYEDEAERAASIGAYLEELPRLRELLPDLKPSGQEWFKPELWEAVRVHVRGPRLWAKAILDDVAAGRVSADEHRAKLAWEALGAELQWGRDGMAGHPPRIPLPGDNWQQLGKLVAKL